MSERFFIPTHYETGVVEMQAKIRYVLLMILAAHQPQYLPWLGYFHKMAACDIFIYMDDVQYKKREFQNRNRIRVKEGEQWLTVPVLTKGLYLQEIRSVKIETGSWAQDHWTTLRLAYGKAHFWSEHAQTLQKIYETSWTKLMGLCEALIDFQRVSLSINTTLRRSSEFSLTSIKSQRLLDLCRILGADTYLSGQGARDYLDETLFQKAGVKVIYQDFQHPTYSQTYSDFISHLAALDLLLNHGPQSRDILLSCTKTTGA